MGQEKNGKYGDAVEFVLGTTIHFPDFDFCLKEIEQGHVIGHLQLAPIFNFEVKTGNEKSIIKWSSGTGEISPEPFLVNNKNFDLQMHYTEDGIKLGEDQIVIRKLSNA